MTVRIGLLAEADESEVRLSDQVFNVKLKPEASRTFRTRVALPADLAAGTYRLLATIDPAGELTRNDQEAPRTLTSESFPISTSEHKVASYRNVG